MALSARAIYDEIRSDDTTFRLFCSIAAKGESQGGWENARIAALTPDATLADRIRRHGADEDKHGRIFLALLRKRGLEPIEVPDRADYCMQLERAGIGLAHARLAEERPLDDEELLAYLVHSRVTEQRAFEEVELQKQLFADDAELGKAIRTIAADEENHLAYCHEELLRMVERGYAARVRSMLRRYAQVEAATYRDVSLAVMDAMGEALEWSRAKRAILAFGIRAIWVFERLVGWRRMTTLRMPARRDALGPRRATA